MRQATKDVAASTLLLGLTSRLSWASTGGGAVLELLQGDPLPGLAVIPSP